MDEYYSNQLNSNKLKKCYDIAPERIQQFLCSEIEFVRNQLKSTDTLLDIGCGYGRVVKPLANYAHSVIGVDISVESIELANRYTQNYTNCKYYVMNAKKMSFPDNFFDVSICVQNGISAFKIDPFILLSEALRVTKKGGIVLFSSYSPKFWEHRLHWFQLQSALQLIGEIDYEKTKDGIILCKDGFKATTFLPKDFNSLLNKLEKKGELIEIDNSILFCKIIK